jgi:hypothetical protein
VFLSFLWEEEEKGDQEMKKIALVLFLVALASFGASMYITKKVEEGKMQIHHAQKRVDQGSSLFSLTPLSKDVGDTLADPMQKKIDEGNLEVEKYEGIARLVTIGGIVCILLSVGALILSKKQRRR